MKGIPWQWKREQVYKLTRAYGEIWYIMVPKSDRFNGNRGFAKIIFKDWKNANHFKKEWNNERLCDWFQEIEYNKILKTEWIDRDRQREIREGKSEFDIDREPEVGKSIVVRGIVEARGDDDLIIQHKMVELGCWTTGNWKEEVKTERLGRKDEWIGKMRPVKVTFASERVAEEVYMRHPGWDVNGVKIHRFRSGKAMRETRLAKKRGLERGLKRWKKEVDEEYEERSGRPGSSNRQEQQDRISARRTRSRNIRQKGARRKE